MSRAKDTKVGGGTRMRRARVIRASILDQQAEHGTCGMIDIGGGREARILRIDAGMGWTAWVTTRFSGVETEPDRKGGYEQALHLQLDPPRHDDVVIDLEVAPFGKVLSIGSSDGVDTLIGMRPGPWEAKFGLPVRPWPPSVASRMARNAAVQARTGSPQAEASFKGVTLD